MALKLASDPQALAVVAAVTAAGFAVLHVRLGWRGFGSAAIASALASFGSLLNPDLLRPLFAGHGSPVALAAAAAISAAVVFGASRMVHDKEKALPIADALATAALLIALTGAFLLLRFWGVEGAGTWRLDPFIESSLRTVLSLTAGLLSTLAVRDSSHPIGRWRGHVLLVLGLLQAALLQLLVLNPLWAYWVPAVSGPPLLDSLALGFLAPALLLGAAASQRVTRVQRLTTLYAASAFVFGVAWAVLEIRRLFQGVSLHIGIDHIGRAEVASYALLGLLLARGLVFAAGRKAGSLGGIGGSVRAAARVWTGFALAFAVVAYGDFASPWWGPITRPLDSQAVAALLLGLYLAGAAAALWLTRATEAAGEALIARAGRIATVIVVFALLNVLTRWAFRGLDMGPNNDEASLQTWTFSAVWGLYGFGLLIFATVRKEADLRWAGLAVLLGTTAKVFIFDMATWRASYGPARSLRSGRCCWPPPSSRAGSQGVRRTPARPRPGPTGPHHRARSSAEGGPQHPGVLLVGLDAGVEDRGGDIVGALARGLGAGDQRLVVADQFAQHGLGVLFGIAVLHAREVGEGAVALRGERAQRPDALGDLIDGGPHLGVLGHEERMERREIGTPDIPVIAVGLQIDRVGVGEQLRKPCRDLVVLRIRHRASSSSVERCALAWATSNRSCRVFG